MSFLRRKHRHCPRVRPKRQQHGSALAGVEQRQLHKVEESYACIFYSSVFWRLLRWWCRLHQLRRGHRRQAVDQAGAPSDLVELEAASSSPATRRRSCAAGEEGVQLQLEKKLVEQEKKLVEHRQISRASPFCYVIDILC